MRRRERENWAKCLPVTAARVAAVVAANKIRMEHRNFMIDGRNKFANQKHWKCVCVRDRCCVWNREVVESPKSRLQQQQRSANR